MATLRTAVLEPVFGSATGRARRLLDGDAAVRAPLPVCRRLGFVQLAAGSGTTTAAAGVVDLLAARRAGRVLAVDASPSPYGLLARLAGGGPALDLRAGPGGVAVAAWSAAVEPLARHHDVVVTDWGLRHPARDLGAVLAASHAVALVVRAEEPAVRVAAALLAELAGRPGVPPVVVTLVTVRRPPRPARRLPAPVVLVPHADPRPGSRVRPGCLELAAELMRAAGGPA